MILIKKKSKILILLFISISALAFGTWWHFFRAPHYFFYIPIVFNENFPCTEIEIEGKKYLSMVDLGSKLPLALRGDVLEKLKKKPKGSVQWRDVKGNHYEMPAYLLNQIKMGNHIFFDVIANEEDYNFFTKGAKVNSNSDNASKELDHWQKIEGTIGRPLLTKFNLLLDLGHFIIIAMDSLEHAKVEYDIASFKKVPFERLTNGSIILKAITDSGLFNLELDTGATFSFVRVEKVKDVSIYRDLDLIEHFVSSKFIIGGVDFGPVNLSPYELTPLLPHDGYLGMNFLSNHIIYLDFKNNIAYISIK